MDDSVSKINLDEAFGELSNDVNEPSLHFVEQQAQEKQEQQDEHSHLRDKLGYTFDPDLHLTNSDGSPKLNADNTLRRRRKRKKTSRTVSEAAGQQLTADQQHAARMAGVAAANTFISFCRYVGGEEWIPQKDSTQGIDEQQELEKATGDYFVYKQWTEFSPGVTLALVAAMYVTPRLTLPKTQSKIKSAYKKSADWFGKIAKRKKLNGSQPHTRDDGQRQVHAGKATGSESVPQRST